MSSCVEGGCDINGTGSLPATGKATNLSDYKIPKDSSLDSSDSNDSKHTIPMIPSKILLIPCDFNDSKQDSLRFPMILIIPSKIPLDSA